MTTPTTNNTLTAVPGIRVGHATDLDAATGCTVVICPPNTVGGVDQRGGAPGTRETDLLTPMHHVSTVSAILLAGGSAFGLAAADGVVRWCEENEVAYRSGLGFLVPIVPAAILMDLPVGRSDVRPDAVMGYAASAAATTRPVVEGSVGAGTGARIGGFRGNAFATKGGIGSTAVRLAHDLIVAALVAVNAVGDILDEKGNIMAGVRADDGSFAGMLNLMRQLDAEQRMPPPAIGNTVIGVVATNARLSKEQVNKVAQMAHDGLARAVNPAHTMYDGDTIFGLATGQVEADVNVVGAYAAEVMAEAIRSGVRAATTVHDVRAWNDWYPAQV
jgi:L-aminopeptidase/D-esterase-like protein